MRAQEIATYFNQTIIAVNNITRLQASDTLLFMLMWWQQPVQHLVPVEG